MYSAGLTVEGNRSDGDRDHGLLLNYSNRRPDRGQRSGGGR